MSLKNVTLPQALILIALIGAVIAAYKMFGEGAGAVMLGVQGAITFLLGRGNGDPPAPGAGGPGLKVIAGGAAGAMLLLVACGAALPAADDPELLDVAAKLAKCRADARAYAQTSADPQSQETALLAYDVYEKCKTASGLGGAGKDGGQ